MEKLMLIDGHSILNRAYYALPPLSNSKGVYTNAVLGFINILNKYLDTENPDYLAVAFDLHGPTFRHEMYQEYKGTRKGMDDELRMQVPMIQELLSAMEIPVITKESFEADDILGTLSKKAQKDGYEVIVVSGDRDLLQLADKHIKISIPKTKKGVTVTEEYYESDVIETLGVTPLEFIDVKALWGDTSDNIPGVPGIGEKTAFALIKEYHSLEEAYKNVDNISPKRASTNLKENIELARLSRTLAEINIDCGVKLDMEKARAKDFYNEASYKLCFEWELKSILKRFSLEDSKDIPTQNEYKDEFVGDIFVTGDIKGLLHQGKGEGLNPDKVFDLSLAAYLLDPLRSSYDFYNSAKTEYENLKKALEDTGMGKLYDDIELPLAFLLYEMEREGIGIDSEELKEYGDLLGKEILRLEEDIYNQVGEKFNINSPKQLGEILFEKMGIPGGKKTKTGYSTAADVLEKLSVDYPVVNNILLYRTHAKLKSTYADGLLGCIGDDNRVHTSFQQTVTATGRLSSTNPNLQNIPIRMELGRMIRKVFKPKEGHVFIDADYSQIELRVLAHMSDDEHLIEAYRSNADIHRATAAKVFKKPYEEVTSQERSNAKAVNFGIVYGISSFGLGQDLNISRKEAQQYIDDYYLAYPTLKQFLENLVERAKTLGYAQTIYGRRRPIPELKAKNFMQRQFGERVAMNSPIQGSAADIIKIAMLNVDKALKENGFKAKLILQVHDELLIEAPENEALAVTELLSNEMMKAADLKVPLIVDVHQGKSWFDAK